MAGERAGAVLVFPAYLVLAVAIGILAGTVVRRTVLAAAVTVGAYLVVRLSVEFFLRPRYREPLTTLDPAEAARGLLVSDGSTGAAAPGSVTSDGPLRYQPADRFWEFQLIETTILLSLAVVLLAVAWRLVVGPTPWGRLRAGSDRRGASLPVEDDRDVRVAE